MTLGEVLVRFGAETSGLIDGIKMIVGAFGLFSGASKVAGGGMALMSSQIAATEARLAFLKGSAIAGGVGFNGLSSQIAATEARLASLKGSAAAMNTTMIESSAAVNGLKMAFVALIAIAALAVVALVTIGTIGVKAAADFQQGLTRLKTGAGDVTDNLAKLGQGILKVSTDTGVLTSGTDGLNAAMYQIISSGQRGAMALNTLSVAAKGAQIEQANVVDVANVLSGAMTNYGTKQFNATQFMNGFITAVQHGKITLQDLAVAMGPIDPIAQSLGIHFNDVAAAMTTQTNAMIPAERAATGLRFMFMALENPTKKAKDEMAALGLDSVKVGDEMKVSLPGALQMIVNAAKKVGPEGSVPFNRAVGDMVGGVRGLSAFMALTGPHMKDFSANSAMILSAMQKNRDAVIGWDAVQGNFNIQMDKAKAAVQALLITLGTALLPILSQLVGKIVPIITNFTNWVISSHAVENALKFIAPIAQAIGAGFMAVMPMLVQLWNAFSDVVQRTSKWLAENKGFMEALKFTLIALGAVIGGILLAALVLVVAAFVTVGIAIMIIVGIVNGAIQVVHAFGDVWNRTGAAIQVAIAWIVTAFHTLVNAAVTAFNAVKQAIVTAFQATIAWITNAWNAAIAFIVGIWNTLKGAATAVWNAITTAIQTAVNAVVNWLKAAWNAAVQAVVAAFQWLYAHNYYFQALCDTIRNVVSAVISWLTTAWNNVVQFIVNVWNTLRDTAVNVWNAITSAITSTVSAVVSWLQGAWAAVVSFLTGLWNALRSAAVAVWNAISSVIQSAATSAANILRGIWNGIVSFLAGIWATIIGAVHSAWASITGAISSGVSNAESPITRFGSWLSSTFAGFARAALNWGANIIKGIANGIEGAIGWVKNAVGDVMGVVGRILGFHSPAEEGPGRDLDLWGPALARGFAQGITKGIPEVQAAVNLMMRPVESTMTTGVTTSGANTASQGGGTSEIITLLRSIDKKLDQGQPISRYQLTQALGLLLAEGVRR